MSTPGPPPDDRSRMSLSFIVVMVILALVLAGGAAGGYWYLVGRTNEGQLETTIEQTGDFGVVDLQSVRSQGPDASDEGFYLGAMPNPPNVLVHRDTIYATAPDDRAARGRPGTVNVVAFDISSGKPRWTKAIKNETFVRLVGTEDDDLIAVARGHEDREGRVLRLDAANGGSRVLGEGYRGSDGESPIGLKGMTAGWTGSSVVLVDWVRGDTMPYESGDQTMVYSLE